MSTALPANLASSVSVPTISALPFTTTPTASPALTTEYMNQVANSIQKSKVEDEEKHQTAVQKTLALALKKKEEENKKQQEEQAKKSAELLKEIAE